MLFIACSRYISSISIIIVTNICLSFTRGHDSAQASQQITTTAHTHTHGSRVRATWLSRVVADMANKKSLFSNELSRIVVRIQNITPERPDIAHKSGLVARHNKRVVVSRGLRPPSSRLPLWAGPSDAPSGAPARCGRTTVGGRSRRLRRRRQGLG